MVILVSFLTPSFTKGEETHCDPTQCEVNEANLQEEGGFSLFSLFKSRTPFQQALEASVHATPDVLCFYEKMKDDGKYIGIDWFSTAHQDYI